MMERICRGFSKRTMSLLLVVCMVIALSPPITAVSTTGSGKILITGFAALAEEVREQNVPIGTSSVELALPDTLEATGYPASEDIDVVSPPEESEPTPAPSQPQDIGMVDPPPASEETSEPQAPEETAPTPVPPADAGGSMDAVEPVTQVLSTYVENDIAEADGETTNPAAVTVEGVTWESDPAYDGETEGEYIFAAVLPSGYTVEEGVSLPKITVTVVKAEQSAVDKVIAMIDALPSYAELTANTPADSDPEYGAWLDKTKQTLADITAAKAAYDALSDEEKLLIDETSTAKLLELAELAEQMALIMPMAADFGTDCTWEITPEGVLILAPKTVGVTGTLPVFYTSKDQPWYDQRSSITSVEVKSGVKANADSSYLFASLFKCTEMDLSGLDTSDVTSMNNMFNNCRALGTLDLKSFDTTKVENMQNMFSYCEVLTAVDLSSFDTTAAQYMSLMFYQCTGLKTITFGDNFTAANVTRMGSMFKGCTSLVTLNLGKFNAAKVTDTSSMFSDCSKLKTLTLGSFTAGAGCTMNGMFSGCYALTALNLSGFDTTNVTDMGAMFANCQQLGTLTLGDNFKTAKVTDMSSMFNVCSALTALNVSGFVTTEVTNMGSMFGTCQNIKVLDLSGFGTAKVTNMSGMFNNCQSLNTLNLSTDFKTGQVTDMNQMFYGCNSLKALDVSGFVTTEVMNMSGMFAKSYLQELDLSGFNTAKVTNMSSMFEACTGLTELDLGSKFITANVTKMGKMFSGCTKLNSLDLTGFNFDKVTEAYMNSMLAICNLGLKTSYYDNAMFGTKLYLYDKYSKADLADTGLTGEETNIIYKPYAVTKSAAANGSFATTSRFKPTDYENYFTKTAGFYAAGTAPSYDNTKEYAQLGEEVTINFTPASGYAVDTVTVMEGSNAVSTTPDGDKYTFIMPAGDVTIAAAFKALPAPTVDTTAKEIFANGIEIKIEATDLDYNWRSNILYDIDGDGTIGAAEWLKIGDEEPTEVGYDLRGYIVYGGTNGVAYTGNTKITHFGGNIDGYYNVNNIGNIYGGCKNADMTGDTEIIITGGCPGGVYGGGYKGKVTGDTHITVSDTGAAAGLLGGGYYDYDMSYPVSVGGSTYINVSSTVFISTGNVGEIRGGGYYDTVAGDTHIEVSGDTTSIPGGYSIVGAGFPGNVNGNTNITITGGKLGVIYGGSFRTSSSKVGGTTNITITGGRVQDIHGGTGEQDTQKGGNITLGAGVSVISNGISIANGTSNPLNDAINFKINPTLTGADGCIVVFLTSEDFVEDAVIATNASASDVAKIELNMNGKNAEGKELYFDSNDNTIKVRTAPNPEEKPAIVIDYANAKLTGFVDGATYTINKATVTPGTDGTLAIKEEQGDEWFGKDINIIRKASDADHSNSPPQKISIPSRPQIPYVSASDETASGAKDGMLMRLKVNTKYLISSDGGKTWIEKTTVNSPGDNGVIKGLAPGTYIVRVAPTDSDFASLPTEGVIINGAPKADITAKLTVTIGGWAYGDTAKTPIVAAEGITLDQSKADYTYSGTANDGTTLQDSATPPPLSGSYTVTAKYEDDMQYGTATSDSFTITKAPLTITGGTVTSRGYTAGDKSATVTAVTFGGLKNGETLAITTDYTVSGAAFADANVGTNKPVTATVALETTAKTANYTLSNSSLNTTGTITKEADGTKNPDYAAALAELKKVHIITNATPTLETVKLPKDWSFTGDKTAKLTASNDNGGKQSFAVLYTSKNPNYPDVTIAAQPFPVSTVTIVMSKLEVVVIDAIGGEENLSATLTVIGAPLANDIAIAGMEWRSSCPEIVSLSNASMGGTASVTAKGDKKGVSMVGVAYKGGDMLGYVLVKVIDSRDDSSNTIGQIKDIADTLDKLVDRDNPTAGDKGAVNAVADEVTKLPEAAKDALAKEDVKALDELKQQINNTLTITIDETPEGIAPPAPTGVTAVGTAIACGVDTGSVTYYVTPVQPTGTDTKLELKLEMNVGGNKEQLKAPLFFTLTLPSSVDVSNLKIKHIMENGSEEISFTASGQSVSFKLGSFSQLQFIVASGSSDGDNPGGGSGGSSYDGQYDFWQAVEDKIKDAENSDTVFINTKDYDKMPWYVMDALRDNPGVTLVIKWNGGDDITIPAGKAQPEDPVRIYWPLSLLVELYKPQPSKDIPVTGNTTIEITAPDGTVTPKEKGKADTPEQADDIKQDGGKDLTLPGEDDAGQDSNNGQEDSKQTVSPDADRPKKVFCLIDFISGGRTNFNCWWCWIVLAVLLSAGVAFAIKSKKNKSRG